MKVQHTDLPEKVQNISENLRTQVDAMMRRDNSHGYTTRYRYKDAEYRFCDFLAENYRLKNLKNVGPRHLYAYIAKLNDMECMPKYIRTELSGIRWFHTISGSKNRLPTNTQLKVDSNDEFKYNRAFLPAEFDKMIKVALEIKRYDVVIAANLGRYFGLRLKELTSIRVWQIEEGLQNKQLHIKNGKGGQRRDVPVDTQKQKILLQKFLNYARKNGKQSSDYLICDAHKHSVKREMSSLQNWRTNHSDKFIDPERTNLIETNKKPRIERP